MADDRKLKLASVHLSLKLNQLRITAKKQKKNNQKAVIRALQN